MALRVGKKHQRKINYKLIIEAIQVIRHADDDLQNLNDKGLWGRVCNYLLKFKNTKKKQKIFEIYVYQG